MIINHLLSVLVDVNGRRAILFVDFFNKKVYNGEGHEIVEDVSREVLKQLQTRPTPPLPPAHLTDVFARQNNKRGYAEGKLDNARASQFRQNSDNGGRQTPEDIHKETDTESGNSVD